LNSCQLPVASRKERGSRELICFFLLATGNWQLATIPHGWRHPPQSELFRVRRLLLRVVYDTLLAVQHPGS
jgi:hypothetical protein